MNQGCRVGGGKVVRRPLTTDEEQQKAVDEAEEVARKATQQQEDEEYRQAVRYLTDNWAQLSPAEKALARILRRHDKELRNG